MNYKAQFFSKYYEFSGVVFCTSTEALENLLIQVVIQLPIFINCARDMGSALQLKLSIVVFLLPVMPPAKISGYAEVPANNEQALFKAAANQPISGMVKMMMVVQSIVWRGTRGELGRVHENRAGYSFERRSLWDCHVEIEQDRISTLSDEIINDIMGVYRQKNVEDVY
ncbi:hypothetical protein LINPERHAP1_LOCUS37514, partial [Linum perenne]